MTLGLNQPRASSDPHVCRRCDDNGDGGTCTCCGKLHSAIVVPACRYCLDPVERPGDDLCQVCAATLLGDELLLSEQSP